MTYVIGAIAGLAFGGFAGYLKNRLIWKKYLQQSASDSMGGNETASVYGRVLLSYAINVAVLVIAFLVRNIVPFDGTAALIGAAVALSIMNKVLTMKQQKMMNGTQKEV